MVSGSLAVFSLYTILVIAGLYAGSYTTRVIFRQSLPRESRKGPAFCPNCGKRIRMSDQIPLVSYALLHGKCRRCGQKISPMYPATELFGAFMFVFVSWYFGFSLHGYIVCIASLVLYALAIIDLKTMRLPDALTGSLALLGILDIFVEASPDPLSRAAGAACALILWFIRMFTKGGIGFGDVKLTAAAGILLGYSDMITALGFAVLTGAAGALIYKFNGVKKMPFGPWLCAGIFAAALYGNELVQLYRSFIEFLT
ncbi:MAG: prepilin peptidase [Eubacteriaceae bacterium]|jgi:leader peptidase (prepilin peptidase)/N-methyltransferase